LQCREGYDRAKRTPRAVTLTREESIRESSKRHPIDFDIQIGAKRDGTLTAVKVEALGDGGAYINMSPPVMYKTATLGPGPYRVENVDYNATSVLTNNVTRFHARLRHAGRRSCRWKTRWTSSRKKWAWRQRRSEGKTCCRTGVVSPAGILWTFTRQHPFRYGESGAVLDFRPEHLRYSAQNRDGRRIRRGVGIAVSMRGASIGADGNGFDVARAYIEVLDDGSINVDLGLTELGQGLRTCQSQMVAEGMGVAFERICLGHTDTSRSRRRAPASLREARCLAGRISDAS
jgi:CO/xanthine dehydrogenase Mo-binding subunit